MVEFLPIAVDLIAAAASGSAAATGDDLAFRRWLATVPVKEKDQWLRRAVDAPDEPVGSELLRAFQATKRPSRLLKFEVPAGDRQVGPGLICGAGT